MNELDDEPLLSYCERLVPQLVRQRSRPEMHNITKIKKTGSVEDRRFPESEVRFSPGHQPTPDVTTYGGIKLGWIEGVLIPCLLNIWGVMLFLRISWVVAQAGIGLTVAIIAISGVVCVITALSLSAICSNGAVSGGGVYYLVSRSLGAELGASVGIIFAFANAVAASMNTIGFCDSLNDLLKHHDMKIIDNSVYDVRIVGTIALLTMCIICAIGMDWATRTQNILIVIILAAIFNYVVGTLVGPSTLTQRADGFVGINVVTTRENWGPDYRDGNNFFSVFAMYFPAVTGVQAGANICGDLKNPAEAIPKGTLTALVISILGYLAMAGLAGSAALRDASGRVADLTNNTLDACKPNCAYGLHNNYQIMQLMAYFGPFIYGGCWAATLSTALTNLLSVPRLVQALGVDRIYPGLDVFAKRYGKHGEPYRGYVLTFLVSLSFLMIADLDKLAPLITNFYLASYALINFCTFHAAFINHVSWRPTFRYFNTWVSLAGFLMCAVIMVVISWLMALITILVFGALYLFVFYKKPPANWGSSTDAYRYRETVSSILTMTRQPQLAKDYNPRLLALAGRPSARPALLDIAHLLTKMGSFTIVAEIEPKPYSYQEMIAYKKSVSDWLSAHKYRAFFVLVDGVSLEAGVKSLVQCAGLGRLSPNILLIGYKDRWMKCSRKELSEYVSVLRYGFENQLALCILRVPESYNYEVESQAETERRVNSVRMHQQMRSVMYSNSDMALNDHAVAVNTTSGHASAAASSTKVTFQASQAAIDGTESHETTYRSPLFKSFNLNYATHLDAWWLYDDGGLNILVPYIIADRSTKSKMPLRIFALAREGHDQKEAQKFFESLLAMFRIECTELLLITGLGEQPSEESWSLFEGLVEDFRKSDNSDCNITDEELKKHDHKTSRNLRLRELLLENSTDAGLVVMSLPVPRKGDVAASLYMAWLEVLSRDMPPMLFVRGNDSLVIQT